MGPRAAGTSDLASLGIDRGASPSLGAVLSLIEGYGVNFTVLVPTMLAMLVNHPGFRPARLASLRDLVYAGSPMPAALCDQVRALLPDLRLWQAYGMTECSSALTVLSAKDHAAGGEILRSAGRPLLGVTLSIQDEAGRRLGPGQDGEICARGGNFMRQYWNRQSRITRHSGPGGQVGAGG